jgi:hypothetical protein
MSQINLSQDWQAVHEVLARYSIVIKPHGNGLVLQDMNNQRHNMKASSLERNLSKGKLEGRLGGYQGAQCSLFPAQEEYRAEALSNAVELEEYKQNKFAQQKALAEIKSPFLQKLAANKAKWQQKRLAYQLMPLTKKDRAMLIKNSRALEG